MKVKTILITLLCNVFVTVAQVKPQKVNSVVKEWRDKEWYTEQYTLWEKEVKKYPENGDAWINLFAAARMSKITSENDEEKNKWAKTESEIIPKIDKAIKGTYEYYRIMGWYYQIWNTPDVKEQEKIMQYSLKAYELKPNESDIYPVLLNIYQIYKPNLEKQKEISKKMKEACYHSPNLMAMAYNSLINTKENSILITGGDNDTYPLWVAQNADDFRKDVHVWNIYLITLSDYRNRLFKELNIPALEGDNVEQTKIIEHIIKHKGNHALYFFHKGILEQDSTLFDKLYNVGLVYQYSEDKLDNTSLIVDNFENKFLLNHLHYNFYQSEFPEMDQRHNFSYLPGLVSLYEHYALIEQNEKANKTKDLLIRLTEGTSYFEDIKVQLNLE